MEGKACGPKPAHNRRDIRSYAQRPTQVAETLCPSHLRCSEMLAEALGRPEGRVKQVLRDGWARPWPRGAAMFAYMVVHDAHHRGQVCMLAHQLGFRLPIKAAYGIWVWEKLWKECGFTGPR